MTDLDNAQTRLKTAIARLENIIESKLTSLEKKNLDLSAEITSLKEELEAKFSQTQQPDFAQPINTTVNENLSFELDRGLISKQTSKQIDLSLSELKKLVK